MNPVNFLNKLNPKTSNWDGTGGGGFDTIIQGDLGGVMMACDADQLTWAHLLSYYDIGLSYDKFIKRYDSHITKSGTVEVVRWEKVSVSCSLNSFSEMLKPWIYSNYLNWVNDDDMIKRVKKAVKAQDEISHGLALYLSIDPLEENRISKYFKPIKPDTFRRKYKRFAISASKRLLPRVRTLERQIRHFTENE